LVTTPPFHIGAFFIGVVMGNRIFRHRADIEAEVFSGSGSTLISGLKMVSITRDSGNCEVDSECVIGDGNYVLLSKAELHAFISILIECQAEIKNKKASSPKCYDKDSF
jgi:hypothetical protein